MRGRDQTKITGKLADLLRCVGVASLGIVLVFFVFIFALALRGILTVEIASWLAKLFVVALLGSVVACLVFCAIEATFHVRL